MEGSGEERLEGGGGGRGGGGERGEIEGEREEQEEAVKKDISGEVLERDGKRAAKVLFFLTARPRLECSHERPAPPRWRWSS